MRSQTLPSSGILNSVVAVGYGLLQVLLYIFKTPLFWFVVVFLFFGGNICKERFSLKFSKNTKKYTRILSFSILIFLIAALSESVIALKGKIVPERFINIICWFTTLLVCISIFFCGTLIKLKLILFGFIKKKLAVVSYIILILCLCCNDYISTAYKSILSANAYSNIISERENIFKNASLKKNKILVVKSYELSFKDYMQKHYPQSSIKLYTWMHQKPALIFNNNGDTDDQSIFLLKNFYNIDSVVIKK